MMKSKQALLRVALGLSLVCSVTEAFAPAASWRHQTPNSRLAAASATLSPTETSETTTTTTSSTNKQIHTSSITSPKGSKNAWEVHKFGGASLATADLYRTVGDLLIREAAGREDGTGAIPTMAVVSALAGMTDLLVQVVETAIVDFNKAKSVLEEAVESQIALLQELAPPEITNSIEEQFRQDAADVASVVQSLRMIHTVPAVTMEVVTGFGEIWSAQTLQAYLQTQNIPSAWLDAREILVVKSDSSGLGEKGAASTGGVVPLWQETETRIEQWWNTVARERGFWDVDYSQSQSPIVVVTGFVAKTLEGVPTTLKRSGSDYSATIFAKLVAAGRVTMWKNTDGVYTADPRRVPEAFPIASLKYDEAMELAFFGAQVLHPSAMVPCIDNGIPVYVRNIFNPDFEGTVIQGRSPTLKDTMADSTNIKNWRGAKQGEIPIKGITSVDKVALVTLEGASVIGGASAAERFMGAMAKNGITVLIITQASSESSITVAVPENEAKAAVAALQDAFELELSRSTVNSVSFVSGMAIVAIVGEGMALKSGVSSTFMGSLARANVNIRLIAQGSSERQIAVVVDGNDTSRALRAAHMAFTLSETTASLTVLGSTGQIGSALCQQLQDQKERLRQDLGIEMRVNIAACSTKMILGQNSRGLDMADSCSKLLNSEEACDCNLEKVTAAMEADVNPLRVIVDCTNSEQVAEYYERWLAAGINIVGPSRKVPAGQLERYHAVCQAEREHSVSWLFESSVGSALPIFTTLRDLRQTGDHIKVIRGSVSGTMAYVLSTFSETVPFSEAVRKAVQKGYTENDIREDLTGFDMAQKVVSLARGLGLEVNIEDVEVESLIPDEIANKDYPGDREAVVEAVLEDIACVDEAMLERLKAAEANDTALRYKFVIDRASGKCKCSLEAVARVDPLFRLKANENLVAFETSRYETSPLIVKGAAAGPDLAAAGIFSDLLRLTRAYSSLQ